MIGENTNEDQTEIFENAEIGPSKADKVNQGNSEEVGKDE